MATPAMPPFIPTMPYQGDVSVFGTFGPFLIPVEFQGWREEVRSWKDGAYLGAFLSLSPTFRVKGPDAERFFSEHFVNNFANLKVGGSRHGIMCDARGRIMMDGTVLRVADDEYIAIWLSPYIQYAFEQGGYDAAGEDLTGREFLFQIACPAPWRSWSRRPAATCTISPSPATGPPRSAAPTCGSTGSGWPGGLAYECAARSPTRRRSTTRSGRLASRWGCASSGRGPT